MPQSRLRNHLISGQAGKRGSHKLPDTQSRNLGGTVQAVYTDPLYLDFFRGGNRLV